MSETVDTLITIYKMDPGSYIMGSHAVMDATREAGEAIKGLAEGVLALAGIEGLAELGKKSLEVAATFDVMERKLAGLTGSFARAKQIMDFGEHEAGLTGLFDPIQLDKASMKLEAFGLQAEKYLPLVEKLGAVFGESGEGLDVFAVALGRIAEGDPGRAMMILARAGIGTVELKKHGVQFKGREVTSSPAVVTTAIEQIVAEKYSGVLGSMVDSPEAKFQRLSVLWEAAMRKMGGGLQTMLLPVVKALSDGLTKITESGQLDRIIGGFGKLFGIDGGQLENVVERIANLLEAMPARIANFQNRLTSAIKGLEPILIGFAAVWAGILVAGKVAAFASAVITAFTAISTAIATADSLAAAFDALTGNLEALAAGALALGAGLATAWYVYEKLSKLAADAGRAGTGEMYGPPKPNTYGAVIKTAQDRALESEHTMYLRQVSEHTARMAELQQRQLDISRVVSGGGDLLAHSLSNADLAGMAAHGSRGQAAKLAVAIMDIIDARAAELAKRQGRLRTAS